MPAANPQTCTENFTSALIDRDMDAALALLTDQVVFFYSNGSTVIGKAAFRDVMTASWKMVDAYTYETSDPAWIAQSDSAAAVVYRFSWTGKVRDQAVGGVGRATRVLTNDGLGWRIAHEHLSVGDRTS
jgi:ketosteroid isomerase-like protein